MILLNGWTVPWSSDVVFELIGIDEDEWAQERYENNRKYIEYSKESMHLEDAVPDHKGRYKRCDVIDESKSVAENMTKDWNESKNA